MQAKHLKLTAQLTGLVNYLTPTCYWSDLLCTTPMVGRVLSSAAICQSIHPSVCLFHAPCYCSTTMHFWAMVTAKHKEETPCWKLHPLVSMAVRPLTTIRGKNGIEAVFDAASQAFARWLAAPSIFPIKLSLVEVYHFVTLL